MEYEVACIILPFEWATESEGVEIYARSKMQGWKNAGAECEPVATLVLNKSKLQTFVQCKMDKNYKKIFYKCLSDCGGVYKMSMGLKY